MENVELEKSGTTVSKFSYIVINLIFIIFCTACLIPVLLIIAISFTDETVIYTEGYNLIPSKFSLDAYRYIFEDPGALINSYTVSIFVTVVGTLLSLLLMTSFAYVLSRKDYKYRKFSSYYLYITMIFSGGIVPWYVLVSNTLHLKDTIFALFVPALVSAWYVFLLQGFFSSIPFTLIESAKIDGASEFRIYFTIVIPLAKASIATVALFSALGFWNDWWLSLILINNSRYVSLQYLLYKVMANAEYLVTNEFMAKRLTEMGVSVPTFTMRMAMCILAAGPMLVIFPFFQKYFVKGITIGSIKG